MRKIPAAVLRAEIVVAFWDVDRDDAELPIKGGEAYRDMLEGRTRPGEHSMAFVPVKSREEAEALLRQYGEVTTQ
jgi:hypothetical protein